MLDSFQDWNIMDTSTTQLEKQMEKLNNFEIDVLINMIIPHTKNNVDYSPSQIKKLETLIFKLDNLKNK